MKEPAKNMRLREIGRTGCKLRKLWQLPTLSCILYPSLRIGWAVVLETHYIALLFVLASIRMNSMQQYGNKLIPWKYIIWKTNNSRKIRSQ